MTYKPGDCPFACDLKAGMDMRIAVYIPGEQVSYVVDLRDVTQEKLNEIIEKSNYIEVTE